MQDALTAGFLECAGGDAQLSFRYRWISIVNSGLHFLDERLEARFRRLVARVTLQVLFVSFIFGRYHSSISFRSHPS